RTLDGGGTWSAQASGTSQPLTDIAVLSDHEAWVSGCSVLLHTVDGGDHWGALGRPLGLLSSVRFAGALTGIAAGLTVNSKTGFELTTNGGASWTTVELEGADQVNAAQLSADARNGVAALENGRILRTRDGGRTWVL